jgi:D-tyrosyl-tRNA(Tyr) deacylase
VRLLLQRVSRAEVRVDNRLVGAIGQGLVAFVGVAAGDSAATAEAMARRTVELRIFRDQAGLTNRSLLDVGGEVLAISQFTLLADTSRGRRPSFVKAAPPELADELYQRFAAAVAERGVTVARGRFGADMAVALVNDGPFTIWLDSEAP